MLVLVVDDEAPIVQLLIEMLNDAGFDVQPAYDGRSALQLLQRGLRPNVIISDMMMPGLDGWALYQWVRQEIGLNVPFVLMSAGRPKVPTNADPLMRFIPKPFNVGEVIDTIEQLAA